MHTYRGIFSFVHKIGCDKLWCTPKPSNSSPSVVGTSFPACLQFLALLDALVSLYDIGVLPKRVPLSVKDVTVG